MILFGTLVLQDWVLYCERFIWSCSNKIKYRDFIIWFTDSWYEWPWYSATSNSEVLGPWSSLLQWSSLISVFYRFCWLKSTQWLLKCIWDLNILIGKMWFSLVHNQDDLICHELQFQACLNHLIGGVYCFNGEKLKQICELVIAW